MKECCKNYTSAYCPKCGASLEANSLIGLRKYLQGRLDATHETMDRWVADSKEPNCDDKKITQGIARTGKNLTQLESWIAELDKATA